MSGLRHTIHGLYKATAEAVLPPRSQSAITDKGVLTPEEFVQAGDYLVRTCPTWSWQAGEPSKAKPYLPKDKQYLVTRNVPCVKRTAAVDGVAEEATLPGGQQLEGDNDDWVAPQVVRTQSERAGASAAEDTDIVDIDAEAAAAEVTARAAAAEGSGAGDGSGSDIPDIDDLAIEDDEEADEATAPLPGTSETAHTAQGGGRGAILRTRTYDLMISYDKYYQVPRIWLAGYDEHGTPLTTAQVFEDVTEEHARKTITVDPFPHTSNRAASIHPCKHANVMTKLGGRLEDSGKQLSCDNYLIIFLKFIASIVPNIEYDFTLAASL